MSEAYRLHRAAQRRLIGGLAAAAFPLLALATALWAGRSLAATTAVGAFARWCQHSFLGQPMPWMWASVAALVAPPALFTTRSAVRRLRVTRRFCAELASWVPVWPAPLAERLARLGVHDRVRLWPAEVADIRTIGLFRPVIVATTRLCELLTPNEFEAVLRHELYHLRRRDPLKVLLAGAVRDGFGWLPLVRSLLGAYEECKEFAADAWAASGAPRRTLASALVKLLLAERADVAAGVAAAPFASATEARLAYLLDGEMPSFPVLAWGPLFGSAGLSLLLWGALLGSCLLTLR